MPQPPATPGDTPPMVTLVVRRTIRATPDRLFDAWTRPEELRKWWGPESVTCTDAAVDLTVGGSYRIANQFPGGDVIWITGEFEIIDRPNRLVYTWRLGTAEGPSERVSVTFVARGSSTEVTVTHERIPGVPVRDVHEQGWRGCLDGLARYLEAAASEG
jgi:uncharacterized protein YndB with AHSA1/START domain